MGDSERREEKRRHPGELSSRRVGKESSKDRGGEEEMTAAAHTHTTVIVLLGLYTCRQNLDPSVSGRRAALWM